MKVFMTVAIVHCKCSIPRMSICRAEKLWWTDKFLLAMTIWELGEINYVIERGANQKKTLQINLKCYRLCEAKGNYTKPGLQAEKTEHTMDTKRI